MKKTYLFIYLFIGSLFIYSCQKSDSEIKTNDNISNFDKNKNFVEFSTVEEIASEILFPQNSSSIFKNSVTHTKNIKDIKEIVNSDGRVSLYLVNYSEGGFVLLSADKRTQPILGYSKNNMFNSDESNYPDGLEFWLNDAKEQIRQIQNLKIEQSEGERMAWEKVRETIIEEISLLKMEPIEDCYYHVEVYSKGPLLNTSWYQYNGFNDNMPIIYCSGNNIHAYAGCVPIAMAQVMKYHEHPSNYNWSMMPLTYATSTTAAFIEDIHDAISSYYYYIGQPTYDCDGTGVSSSTNMGNIMKLYFDYSSATKADYNYNTVKSNINSYHPVLLSGSNSSTGHMWVCDGYKVYNIYDEDCYGWSYLHLHMNWGWINGQYNGWFDCGNFNPGNTSYNNNKKMIYNIIP